MSAVHDNSEVMKDLHKNLTNFISVRCVKKVSQYRKKTYWF